FFTIVFPLLILILFAALFGGGEVDTEGGNAWPVEQFFVGGLGAFTAATATYTNIANMLPLRRDEGVLKRWRGTATPPWVILGGYVGAAIVLAAIGVTIMVIAGALFYDLEIDPAKLPAAVLTFLVGCFALSALGMAIASVIPNAESASAVANATILPLSFASDIFIVTNDPPRWLELIGDVFPLKAFVNAFQDCFNPFIDAPGFDWGALAFVAAWGVGGAAIATWKFRWEPSRSATTGRRARRARRRDIAPAD
ncbi:MAG: ABC transporter permease, partial [Actinomycetota bacterium]